MIIRIMGEGQYRAPEALCNTLNQIDNRIVELVEEGKTEEFRDELAKMISEIKEKGEPVEAEEILESDIIVPPGDLSLEEAKAVFKGSGIFQD
ncbi:MAG: PspA-associated protein PspAA [Methanosarcina sp.]|jgi:polyhydroxyalkanoate synthesis regulator phasin